MMIRYMPLLVVFLALLMAGAVPAHADVTPFRECGTLFNSTDQQVMGVIKTEAFKFQGKITRHEKNFVLQPDETVSVCSTGPFFPGYKVELTIRTIMPLFTCRTRLSGNIYLRKKWDDEHGVYMLYADCK